MQIKVSGSVRLAALRQAPPLTRRAGGEISYLVGHVPRKPNNLCLVSQWDTAANAAKFLKSTELKAAMKGAGVTAKPDIFIVEEKDNGKT